MPRHNRLLKWVLQQPVFDTAQRIFESYVCWKHNRVRSISRRHINNLFI